MAMAAACTGSAEGAGIGVATDFNIRRIPEAERVQAPPIDGEMLAGETVAAADLAGSLVVINFWGSWCGPCRREQPLLEAGWQRLGPEVRFVGVNTRRDQRAAALAFLEEFSVTYPSIYDPSSELANEFGVRFMPATFVLDRQGRIAAEVIGALRTEAELVDVLEDLAR
jgi:thiol-disulfide isomerase/thioredoxin